MTNSLMCGIQPFWFWNGEMEEAEICRQIGEMKEQGLKGFLIHPRQGLEVPYLSELYFEKVKIAVAEAKKKQMEVWLYDEFPYPSGVSGGKVTLEHPEYACMELTKTCGMFQGGETAKLYAPWGKVLLARAYRVVDGKCLWEDFIDLSDYVGSGYKQDVFQMSGLTVYNKKRYFQGELAQYLCWRVPEGEWSIYLYTETVMRHFKYFETFIDPLNPEAVRFFIETTHEKYKKYVGDEFGNTIKGVFTDEVTAFPPFHPWSALLPGLVANMSGLDLISHLPALSEDMGEITYKIRYAYWNAATEQFIDSWDKQVYGWCEENNLLYIGEKPILRSKELAYTHVPGIDAGHQKFGSPAVLAQNKYRANGKIASSAAHFYQKPAALCEAFHSIGWGMNLQDAKWIFDWLAVMGIDWFITHGAYYTTDALKKHDAPPSFFYQMPWWKNTHKLSAYVEKLNKFQSEGTRRVSVLLLDPITSTWTETDERLKRLNKDFADFQNELLRKGVDYYVMDPQLFESGHVKNAEGKICYENCGDSYEMIVLPFMTNLEAGAAGKIREYAGMGGILLAAGTLPYREMEGYGYSAWIEEAFHVSPAPACETYFQAAGAKEGLWQGSCYFSGDYQEVVRELQTLEEGNRPWKVHLSKDGAVLQIQSKGKNGEEKLFLTNIDAQTVQAEITIKGVTIYRRLDGGESLFLNEDEMEALAAEQGNTILDIDIAEEMDMQVSSWNALRISKWKLKLEDGQSAWVDSIPLIDQMEAAGLKIDICQKDYFGCPKELEFPEIQAEYTYYFLNRLERTQEVHLLMEPGTLLGHWSLEVNGTVFGPEDFAGHEIYLSSNLTVNVTNALLPGKNCLKLNIQSPASFGGIRNPLYLCGRFSVLAENDSAVLEPQRTRGAMNDLTGCGLPYYAGTVEFTKQLSKEMMANIQSEDMVYLEIKDKKFRESLQMKLGEELIDICAFAPYKFKVSAEELLKQGQVTLCLNTSLCRLFEGEYFDEEQHKYMKSMLN